MINRKKRIEFWADTYRNRKRRERLFLAGVFLTVCAAIGLLGILIQ